MKKRRKVLITGGEGVLAGYVRRLLQKKFQVFSPSHKELDITDKRRLTSFFKNKKPDFVIHLAAYTNVDEGEKNARVAFGVNSEATRNIAKLCQRFDSFLVYTSTAAVFNGKKKIFYEDDKKGPVNVYGKSKLKGEEYIQEILDKFAIVRLGWLIGGGKKEKKFVSYIVEKAKSSNEIPVVTDKVGTISYAKEVAEFIGKLLNDKRTGVYHFGSRGEASRFDIAKAVVKLLGSKTKLVPVASAYFATAFSAPRPDREVLGSKKIKFPSDWEESLELYFYNEILKE